MFEIVFLGTSASAPSIYRGLSSAAVLAGEDRFLVDCGEGTQRQILRSGIGFKRLNRILLTHAHLDHILGLGGLVSTFTRWENIDELFLWGGKHTLERVHSLIYDVVLHRQTPRIPIHFNAVEPGLVYQGRDFTVTAFSVQHRGRGCFGYTFQEKTHRPFLVEKAEALGVPAGPERGQLVRGETIMLSDGRQILPEMVLADPIPGAKIVFTGDTSAFPELLSHIQDADALVIEATFLHNDREMAQSYGHLTARQAAELAREANVKNLLLNHVSRRYREFEIINEARSVFPDAIVARDLDHFIVKRGQPVVKRSDPMPTPEDDLSEDELLPGE